MKSSAKCPESFWGTRGLKIAVEGYTDSVGGDEYNMKLSENRANAVREYLVTEGLSPEAFPRRDSERRIPSRITAPLPAVKRIAACNWSFPVKFWAPN